MTYVIIGCLGFLLIHLFDILSLKRLPVAKPVAWTSGNGLLIYALVMVCLEPHKFALPAWSSWLGWALLAISSLLLVCALYVSLPLRKTYVTAGISNKLITTGLYALVRHPGVHWFIVLLLSLVLVFRTRLLLIAAPIFILVDLALVFIQDKFVFGWMFQGYESYRQKTPMLLPNRQSISAFINSVKQQFRV